MQDDAEQPVLLESQTQWQICHVLCFPVNANQTAQCWAVMTTGGMRMMGLTPPSWSLFLPVWKFYWHRFCGVPTVHSYGYAQFSSLNGLYPPHSFNSTYGCTILLGVVLPVKPEWAEGNVSSNRLWQQHFQKAKLEKNLSGKLSRNNAVKPPLASCFFFWVVFLLSLHCICSHFYFHQSRRNGFTILYALLAGQIDTSEVKPTWFYIVVIKCCLIFFMSLCVDTF